MQMYPDHLTPPNPPFPFCEVLEPPALTPEPGTFLIPLLLGAVEAQTQHLWPPAVSILSPFALNSLPSPSFCRPLVVSLDQGILTGSYEPISNHGLVSNYIQAQSGSLVPCHARL